MEPHRDEAETSLQKQKKVTLLVQRDKSYDHHLHK